MTSERERICYYCHKRVEFQETYLERGDRFIHSSITPDCVGEEDVRKETAEQIEKLVRECDHFPHVLNGLRPSDLKPFSVCLQCGAIGYPQQMASDRGPFGRIKWKSSPARLADQIAAIGENSHDGIN